MRSSSAPCSGGSRVTQASRKQKMELTPPSSTLKCFIGLSRHLGQLAEKGTSWKQTQGKWAITKLLHFMKMAGYSADFWPTQYPSIYSLFLLNGENMGRKDNKGEKQIPGLQNRPCGLPWKVGCLPRENSGALQTKEASPNSSDDSVLLSGSGRFLTGKHHALEDENPRRKPPFSCTCWVDRQKAP